ncbi:MAG: hypothetical protein QOF77_592 [Solirubrobacteraceae bacterium]|jgi:hypothetical protein|nr:hypothetical protein [Solirubrobacteraceae bacterium]
MTDHQTGRWPVEDLDIDAAGDLLEEVGGGGVAGAVHAGSGLPTEPVPRSIRAAPGSITAREPTSVFGPEAVLTARLPLSDKGANTADPHLRDALTGPIVAIADRTPVICSAGVASPCGLDLLAGAGVPASREIRTYRTAEEFHRLVAEVIGNGERLLCQHVHDEDEVPAEACMVAPNVLRYLNNKANLPAIVGAEGAPRRSSISPGDVAGLGVNDSWVLKVCSEDSSGGGYGVYVHRAGGAVAQPRFVQPGAELIVEEYLDLVENWCVHFCVEAIGRPRLLGATEQLISATGAYGGSRVGGTVVAPAAAELCQAVAERARQMGFIGYCGIDTGLTSSGEVKVFDLNFRINASTPALLVLDEIAARRGPSWEGRGRWQTYRHSGSLPDLVKRLEATYPDRALVPIASYDPAFTANGRGPSLLSGLLMGDDEQDLRRLTELPLPADVGCSASNVGT